MITKTGLHVNNKHRHGYDFSSLVKAFPALSNFIILNKYNQQKTINFSHSEAVKTLNKALLKKHYHIQHWDFPEGYLCPPIPGRADYIHHLNDLLKHFLAETNLNVKNKVNVLDIGTGATCIYPILGACEYDWHFVASDIDPISVKAANTNINANSNIAKHINCRLQKNSSHIFNGIIKEQEFFHLTMCNPPFHKSLMDARQGTVRKWHNLHKEKSEKRRSKDVNKKDNIDKQVSLNFGGQKAELWCQGGELAFIDQMIKESKQFKDQVLWFTCLVSKKDHLPKLKLSLKKAKVSQMKIVNMAQGNKISRFIAWRFNS